MLEIEGKVRKVAESVSAHMGITVVRVEYKKEKGDYFLRVFINKSGGVTSFDCEAVSKALKKKLDEYELINQNYSMEVSSPGVALTDEDVRRILKEFDNK